MNVGKRLRFQLAAMVSRRAIAADAHAYAIIQRVASGETPRLENRRGQEIKREVDEAI